MTEIRSFLGLAGYYCQFENLSRIAAPLTKKDVKFDWDDSCE